MEKLGVIGTIRAMYRDIKIWLFIRYLWEKTMYPVLANKDQIVAQIMAGHEVGVSKKWLIENYGANPQEAISLIKSAEKMNLVRELDFNVNSTTYRMVYVTTEGHEFVGLFPLIQFLLKKYELTWTLVIIPIFAFIIGKYWEGIISIFN